MKEELELLQKLAKQTTTRFSEDGIYKMSPNGLADLNDLISGGYIRLEPIVDNGEERKYYKITLKGWDFLNQLKERKLQIRLTILILILTLVGLVISLN